MHRLLMYALIVAGTAASSAAAQGADKVIELGPVSVALAWNPEWQLDQSQAKDDTPRVAFHAADRLKMSATLTAGPKNRKMASDEWMKGALSAAVAPLLAQSVEKELSPQNFVGDEGRGWYVCATDRAPKRDEYEYLCQGFVAIDDTPYAFTIVSNDGGKSDADAVLTALKNLRRVRGG